MSMKRKRPNLLLGAVTGVTIIAAGGIASAQAQERLERECEPWRPDTFRNGSCGFDLDVKKPDINAPVPRAPTPTPRYTS